MKCIAAVSLTLKNNIENIKNCAKVWNELAVSISQFRAKATQVLAKMFKRWHNGCTTVAHRWQHTEHKKNFFFFFSTKSKFIPAVTNVHFDESESFIFAGLHHSEVESHDAISKLIFCTKYLKSVIWMGPYYFLLIYLAFSKVII